MWVWVCRGVWFLFTSSVLRGHRLCRALSCSRGKLTVFTVLCEQYQPSLRRDPMYNEVSGGGRAEAGDCGQPLEGEGERNCAGSACSLGLSALRDHACASSSTSTG